MQKGIQVGQEAADEIFEYATAQILADMKNWDEMLTADICVQDSIPAAMSSEANFAIEYNFEGRHGWFHCMGTRTEALVRLYRLFLSVPVY